MLFFSPVVRHPGPIIQCFQNEGCLFRSTFTVVLACILTGKRLFNSERTTQDLCKQNISRLAAARGLANMPLGLKPCCAVCKTSSSSMWKKGAQGEILCNNCTGKSISSGSSGGSTSSAMQQNNGGGKQV